MSKINKLFRDWFSCQNNDMKNETRILINSGIKNSNYYDRLVESMGFDGKKMNEMFSKQKSQYGNTIVEQKKSLAKELLCESQDMYRIDQRYEPIEGRSNIMKNFVEEDDRYIVLQIRNAMAAGNFNIANQLLNNFWQNLSLNDKNSLIEWCNAMRKYNTNGHKSMPPVIKLLNRDDDISKDSFINQVIGVSKVYFD